MKKSKFFYECDFHCLIKTFKIMRVTILLLLVSILQTFANDAYSQKTKLSFDFSNKKLVDALSEIEEHTEFYFLYNDNLIDTDRRINLTVAGQTIDKVLDGLFSGTNIKYTIADRKIILTPDYITASLQQQNSVSGKVTDSSGAALPGVTVVVKSTVQGTITGADGRYSFSNVRGGATLVFSFVGMKTQEIPVAGKTSINLVMEEDILGIEEVVAIGYGTARKEDLTGAVVNVKAEEFMKYKPASISDLLRTSVPGLKVDYSTDAKATPDFTIRGDNTIKSDSDTERSANQPLLVVDGVIFNGSLSEINVNDIESIDVLKDASAASIYGSRASNGVVVFTTKKGKTGKPTIRVNAKYGIVTGARRMKTYNGEEVMKWLVDMNESINSKLMDEWSKWTPYNEVPDQYKAEWLATNGIQGETNMEKITSVWLDNFGFEQNEKENYMLGRYYDWQNWLFQTGQRHDYNISLSGREDKITYYWSIGIKDNESVRVGEKFTSITSRLNFDVSVTEFLNIGLNANIAYEDEGQRPIENEEYITLSPYDTPWEQGKPQTRSLSDF
jgi:TonB-dependent SusC/RagA subfamily outer membrane receptor